MCLFVCVVVFASLGVVAWVMVIDVMVVVRVTNVLVVVGIVIAIVLGIEMVYVIS